MQVYPSAQLDLFEGPADVWERLHIDENELLDWFNIGFLSFDPATVTQPARWQIMEAVFIRDLVETERSINTARRMLSELDRPYALRHDRIFWDYQTQRWRSRFEAPIVAHALASSPEAAGQLVRAAIAILADTGQEQELRRIQSALSKRLPSEF